MEYEDESDNEINVAKEIVGRLVGFKVTYLKFEAKIPVNDYVTVFVTQDITTDIGSSSSLLTCHVSSYKFGVSVNNYYDKFIFSTKAEELALKIKDIVEDGTMFVTAGYKEISIGLSVKKAFYKNNFFEGTIGIQINFPREKNREENCQYFEREKDQDVVKALQIGTSAVAGILVYKLIKGGLGALFAGPVGAAIGFAT